MNRRHFLSQTGLAAALYGCQLKASEESCGQRDERGPKGSPLDADSIRKLSSDITGTVITPDSLEYENARLIFNRAFDRHPAVIVRCNSASDVAYALEFARAKHLPLAVRSGGHSRLGYGMCNGGLVIDLSSFKRVDIDARKRVARAQAGALVRNLDEATQSFGLATTSAVVPPSALQALRSAGVKAG